jgi:hypothetical protein
MCIRKTFKASRIPCEPTSDKSLIPVHARFFLRLQAVSAGSGWSFRRWPSTVITYKYLAKGTGAFDSVFDTLGFVA